MTAAATTGPTPNSPVRLVPVAWTAAASLVLAWPTRASVQRSDLPGKVEGLLVARRGLLQVTADLVQRSCLVEVLVPYRLGRRDHGGWQVRPAALGLRRSSPRSAFAGLPKVGEGVGLAYLVAEITEDAQSLSQSFGRGSVVPGPQPYGTELAESTGLACREAYGAKVLLSHPTTSIARDLRHPPIGGDSSRPATSSGPNST